MNLTPRRTFRAGLEVLEEAEDYGRPSLPRETVETLMYQRFGYDIVLIDRTIEFGLSCGLIAYDVRVGDNLCLTEAGKRWPAST